MGNKRQVGFKVVFDLLKGKRPFGILGLALVILSVLILLFMIPFVIGFRGENNSYSFSDIQKYGSEKDAKVTSLNTVRNLSINNVNPITVTYEYEDNGTMITDKSETLDIDKVSSLNAGKVIKILVYDHQSIIKDVEPYFVPGWIPLIPVPFFIVGIILFCLGLVPALKKYSLYRTGVIKDAVITSIDINNNVPVLLSTKIPVSYDFLDDHQNKVHGQSESTDLLFWMQKKAGDIIKILVSKNNVNETCIVPVAIAAKYNWYNK
jgi:hypothetical protein